MIRSLATKLGIGAALSATLLFAAHDLERIGDRVTNICEDVIYMVTGEIEELN